MTFVLLSESLNCTVWLGPSATELGEMDKALLELEPEHPHPSVPIRIAARKITNRYLTRIIAWRPLEMSSGDVLREFPEMFLGKSLRQKRLRRQHLQPADNTLKP
jgi:hypothetical protein